MQEAKMLGQEWDEEPEAPYKINIAKAQRDPKSKTFLHALLLQMKASTINSMFCRRKRPNTRKSAYALLAFNLELEPSPRHRSFQE